MSPDLVFENLCNESLVLSEIRGAMGLITLNRPKKLNTLNREVLCELYDVLRRFEQDERVKFVVFEGKGGKAFCAGGDVRSVYEYGIAGELERAAEVFRLEFDFDYYVANFSKPVIALLDGIVMGGGVGMTIAADFRIVTERTRWAMPEMKIGLFPDVGTSYYLSRMPGHLGRYLCMTSISIGTEDCINAGLADFKVASNKLEALKMTFAELIADNLPENVLKNELAAIIAAASSDGDFSGCVLNPLLHEMSLREISKHFCADSLTEIIYSLRASADVRSEFETDFSRDFAAETLRHFETNSPTSMAVVIEQHRRASAMSLKQCFEQDYVLVQNFLKHRDFYEGVRAILIEKTGTPMWTPNSAELLDANIINSYFD